MFAVGFDHPDWHNGFEHDPEEAARVRVRLMRELAATHEPLVASHLSFPCVSLGLTIPSSLLVAADELIE